MQDRHLFRPLLTSTLDYADARILRVSHELNMPPVDTIRCYDYSQSIFASALVFASALDDQDTAFTSLLFEHGDIEEVASCPYCMEEVSHWKATEYPNSGWWDEGVPIDIDLVLCRFCGWYRYKTMDWLDAPPAEAVHRVAILCKKHDDEPPIQELRRYLTKNWNQRVLLSPARAEAIVADIFREHLDCEIRYTSNGVYAPDGGIDFVLVNTSIGIEYAFQVKRRLTDSPEPVQPIREFVGAVMGTSFRHAYYVTTASRLTKTARSEIANARFRLLERKLDLNIVDGEALLQLLKLHPVLPSTANVIRAKFSLPKAWKLQECVPPGTVGKCRDTDQEYSLEEMLSITLNPP